jgi:hypothetical protein
MEEAHLASAQKKAQQERRVIVFIDESGLSDRPTRVRTWAPKGQTPVIPFHFNWKQLSMIAGVSLSNAYFRLHEGAIKREQIFAFLKALIKQIGHPLLIIWDGLKAHRSRLVSWMGRLPWRFCRPTRLTSIRLSICGPGSSAMRGRATARPPSLSSRSRRAAGSNPPSGALHSSLRFGNRLNCSDVT